MPRSFFRMAPPGWFRGGRSLSQRRAALRAEAAATGTAVMDPAHVGEIQGALGTVHAGDGHVGQGWGGRLRLLLAIMGPGLIVMVGDNDAGGVATYAQAGQNFGPHLLWVLALLVPVLIVNQEMVVRLGAVTGVGHARLIHERFGRFWAAFSIADLVVVNGLTIVTEFIGVALAGSVFGIPKIVSVLVAAAVLVAFTASGSFRRWERWMYLLIAINVVAIPLMLSTHPQAGPVLRGFTVVQLPGGLHAGVLLLVIAIVGTTVAPWQLFFQQSNVVDKRITPRWLAYERADTIIGAFITVAGAGAIMVTASFGLHDTVFGGHFTNAAAVATELGKTVNPFVAPLFAILLLDASLIGAAAVTLSTSYALGDIVGARHSLHRGVREQPFFYGVFAVFIALSAGVVLLPGAPLGLITEGVQALAGVLLPSATVFLVLLCNDREVLGPWINARWLNVVASLIVGVLVLLSLVLTAATLFPSLSVGQLQIALELGVVVALLVGTALAVRHVRARRALPEDPEVRGRAVTQAERLTWRMPPLEQLAPPVWSKGRVVGMLALRGYLIVAVVLIVVKLLQLAGL